MRLHPPIAASDLPVSVSELPVARSASERSPWRRRLLWIGLAVVLLLLLALTPPLVNANRYHRQIADTMSASLGRPVHLDNVSLHLLPVPGFTLQNLVVSEDPSFGSEPTIRANTVEATLRLSSLWRRPVEFSTIRFIEPSVNLVRNPQGRWNLADVLLRTSHVNTAPTDQRRHGRTPRFPYIEATGGRVNIKFGAEKLPFSLTEADFALWLPSPQRWQVRLTGHPARTDSNITDPGTMRVEGELRRGTTEGAVPIDLRASWHNAPLGEASRMLTGDDLGWRGTLNFDSTLTGTLGAARLGSKLTVGDLRRAEFVPAQPVYLQVTCAADAAVSLATLANLACSLPDGAPQPLMLRAAALDLQHPEATAATLTGEGMPVRRALLWAALFSPRVPTDLAPQGTLEIDLARAQAIQENPLPRKRRRSPPVSTPRSNLAWRGEVRFTVPPPSEPAAATPEREAASAVADRSTPQNELLWSVDSSALSSEQDAPVLRLAPTAVRLGVGSTANVDGVISLSGYTFSLKGTMSPAALLLPARYLPQLGDGLDMLFPQPVAALEPMRLDITCSRSWTTAQTCTSPHPLTPAKGPVVPSSVLPPSRPFPLR